LVCTRLHGVWHIKGWSRGSRILSNSRAIVLQQCGQCRRDERMKGRLIGAGTITSERLSCKGQLMLYSGCFTRKGCEEKHSHTIAHHPVKQSTGHTHTGHTETTPPTPANLSHEHRARNGTTTLNSRSRRRREAAQRCASADEPAAH